jgi:hypothetical protein
VAVALAFGVWRGTHPPPPPPWELQGEVIDLQTQMPIAGVEVDVNPDQGNDEIAQTDAQGKYTVRLPQPQPKTIKLRFRKEGYTGESFNVQTDQPFTEHMVKQH